MKTAWLEHKNRSQLIIFCNGWGMDEYPFFPLNSSNYDVLIIYDYLELKPNYDFDSLFDRYSKVVLIAWSMGVWVGQKLFKRNRHRLARAIAVNGTLAPIDDNLGIPSTLFLKTYKNFNEVTNLKFYKRMCREKANIDRFLANQPRRTLESKRLELGFLLNSVKPIPLDQSIYDDIMVANKDLIMPTQNQLRFWHKKQIHRLDGFHFLFYDWQNWDALVDNSNINC